MNFKTKKSGFTLVEMLIVIVIIGVLAASLIPRLASARARANDTARRADLNQLATAMISYTIDKGRAYICTGGCDTKDDTFAKELKDAGMTSIPADPSNQSVKGAGSTETTAGGYGYISITKNGQQNQGFVLMASTETEQGANYLICSGTSDFITYTMDYDTINTKKCTDFSSADTCKNTSGSCEYVKGGGNLRYIYLY